MLPSIIMVMLQIKGCEWFSRVRCYRRGRRYAEGVEILFYFVLYVETF